MGTLVSPGSSHDTMLTEAYKAAVREELERILANQHFVASKRYPSFLRFVTARALETHPDLIKERVVGVEVFGRDPDYDTSADPIVRVTAAEIRKRLEQYYQEPGHEGEVRISLPAGSYIPQFSSTQKPSAVAVAIPPDLAALPGHAPATRRKRLMASLIATGLLVALGIASFVLLRRPNNQTFQEFWRPMVTSKDPVLFCVADQSQFSTMTLRDAANPSRLTTTSDTMVTVVIDDVVPLVNIAGVLQSNGQSYQLKSEGSTTLTDLRQNPTVLIGAYDNSWTLRETADLRFHFANNPEMTHFWIEDRANPGKRDWALDRDNQQKGVYKDFAIIGRFIDRNTDRFVIVAAGIARGGTVAAGEFLVDPRQIGEVVASAPKDWPKKNMELVLETQVIDGRSGPPRVVATHFW
jgi:hypothetical protein